ncbi:protoporphyrinogen oxidase HemJ [Loktanella sp. D2R18]|uniref:protoporphyrinogen oxidase HemJ n=1 Tax=Rhodobacterales TaxID=204455 RepID=UPI000DE8374E|nr:MULTISPECIES: protoporphyrinogen oxidase HemJ [Rhodobacterales]MDO6590461.1 protoporphyrinogen oxidase HemJ [Yoonia sp. 1_MG-2023]RBW41180.1 protoporphyrinogen oxidase HemJ [Loktanella sp. D2R18]
MLDFLSVYYDWIKAIHIMAVISWMAGMFYLPRLFVYHAERAEVGSDLDLTFQIMEEKLLRVIINPAMIVTWVAGLIMLSMGAFDWGSVWSWSKIIAVLLMSGFHGWLSKRRKEFVAGVNTRSGRVYRLANEVPTVLMVIIVVAVVVRPF